MSPVLPELHTERLYLRRLRLDDLPALQEMYAVQAPAELDPVPLEGESLRAKVELWASDWTERGLSYWIAEDPSSGEMLGMGGIRHHVEDDEPVLNLAYRFWPHAWGRGYAVEMARAAVEWAEANLPDVPLSVATTPQHAQSLRVASKLGFTLYRERESKGFAEVLLRRERDSPD